MKKSKPYFQKDVEDRIVSVVLSELSKENKTVDESAVRQYIQAPKNTYENSILSDVSDGYVLATVVRDEIAYKVNTPSEKEIEDVVDRAKQNADAAISAGKKSPGVPTSGQVELAMKQSRAAKLSHALNMVSYYGKAIKLGVEAVALAPQAVESNEQTSTTSTAV